MQTFALWVAAVIRHYVALLGGAGVSVALLVYAQYATPEASRLPSRVWWTGLTAGLLAACFLSWVEERTRADNAQAALQPSVAAQWDEAIQTFRGMAKEEIDAVRILSSSGDVHWYLHGGDAAHQRACETACRVAGHVLLRSKVRETLPEQIANESDPMRRWLEFVGMKDGFHGPHGDGVDNTVKPPLKWTSKSIRSVPFASKRLCEDCKSHEMFL